MEHILLSLLTEDQHCQSLIFKISRTAAFASRFCLIPTNDKCISFVHKSLVILHKTGSDQVIEVYVDCLTLSISSEFWWRWLVPEA